MKNAINWFEIPSDNLDRALPFYERTLGVTLTRTEFGGVPHAMFPADEGGVAGAVVGQASVKAGPTGVVIYLDAPDGVEACLARALAAGGTQVVPKTAIGEHGFIAVVKDLDGNVVGLHALKG
jgi:uncharacterized protein